MSEKESQSSYQNSNDVPLQEDMDKVSSILPAPYASPRRDKRNNQGTFNDLESAPITNSCSQNLQPLPMSKQLLAANDLQFHPSSLNSVVNSPTREQLLALKPENSSIEETCKNKGENNSACTKDEESQLNLQVQKYQSLLIKPSQNCQNGNYAVLNHSSNILREDRGVQEEINNAYLEKDDYAAEHRNNQHRCEKRINLNLARKTVSAKPRRNMGYEPLGAANPYGTRQQVIKATAQNKNKKNMKRKEHLVLHNNFMTAESASNIEAIMSSNPRTPASAHNHRNFEGIFGTNSENRVSNGRNRLQNNQLYTTDRLVNATCRYSSWERAQKQQASTEGDEASLLSDLFQKSDLEEEQLNELQNQTGHLSTKIQTFESSYFEAPIQILREKAGNLKNTLLSFSQKSTANDSTDLITQMCNSFDSSFAEFEKSIKTGVEIQIKKVRREERMRLKKLVKEHFQNFGAKNRNIIEQMQLQISDLVKHLGQSQNLLAEQRTVVANQVTKTASQLKLLQREISQSSKRDFRTDLQLQNDATNSKGFFTGYNGIVMEENGPEHVYRAKFSGNVRLDEFVSTISGGDISHRNRTTTQQNNFTSYDHQTRKTEAQNANIHENRNPNNNQELLPQQTSREESYNQFNCAMIASFNQKSCQLGGKTTDIETHRQNANFQEASEAQSSYLAAAPQPNWTQIVGGPPLTARSDIGPQSNLFNKSYLNPKAGLIGNSSNYAQNKGKSLQKLLDHVKSQLRQIRRNLKNWTFYGEQFCQTQRSESRANQRRDQTTPRSTQRRRSRLMAKNYQYENRKQKSSRAKYEQVYKSGQTLLKMKKQGGLQAGKLENNFATQQVSRNQSQIDYAAGMTNTEKVGPPNLDLKNRKNQDPNHNAAQKQLIQKSVLCISCQQNYQLDLQRQYYFNNASSMIVSDTKSASNIQIEEQNQQIQQMQEAAALAIVDQKQIEFGQENIVKPEKPVKNEQEHKKSHIASIFDREFGIVQSPKSETRIQTLGQVQQNEAFEPMGGNVNNLSRFSERRQEFSATFNNQLSSVKKAESFSSETKHKVAAYQQECADGQLKDNGTRQCCDLTDLEVQQIFKEEANIVIVGPKMLNQDSTKELAASIQPKKVVPRLNLLKLTQKSTNPLLQNSNEKLKQRNQGVRRTQIGENSAKKQSSHDRMNLRKPKHELVRQSKRKNQNLESNLKHDSSGYLTELTSFATNQNLGSSPSKLDSLLQQTKTFEKIVQSRNPKEYQGIASSSQVQQKGKGETDIYMSFIDSNKFSPIQSLEADEDEPIDESFEAQEAHKILSVNFEELKKIKKENREAALTKELKQSFDILIEKMQKNELILKQENQKKIDAKTIKKSLQTGFNNQDSSIPKNRNKQNTLYKASEMEEKQSDLPKDDEKFDQQKFNTQQEGVSRREKNLQNQSLEEQKMDFIKKRLLNEFKTYLQQKCGQNSSGQQNSPSKKKAIESALQTIQKSNSKGLVQNQAATTTETNNFTLGATNINVFALSPKAFSNSVLSSLSKEFFSNLSSGAKTNQHKQQQKAPSNNLNLNLNQNANATNQSLKRSNHSAVSTKAIVKVQKVQPVQIQQESSKNPYQQVPNNQNQEQKQSITCDDNSPQPQNANVLQKNIKSASRKGIGPGRGKQLKKRGQETENILVLPLQMKQRENARKSESQSSKRSLLDSEVFPEGLVSLNQQLLKCKLPHVKNQQMMMHSGSVTTRQILSQRESFQSLLKEGLRSNRLIQQPQQQPLISLAENNSSTLHQINQQTTKNANVPAISIPMPPPRVPPKTTKNSDRSTFKRTFCINPQNEPLLKSKDTNEEIRKHEKPENIADDQEKFQSDGLIINIEDQQAKVQHQIEGKKKERSGSNQKKRLFEFGPQQLSKPFNSSSVKRHQGSQQPTNQASSSGRAMQMHKSHAAQTGGNQAQSAMKSGQNCQQQLASSNSLAKYQPSSTTFDKQSLRSDLHVSNERQVAKLMMRLANQAQRNKQFKEKDGGKTSSNLILSALKQQEFSEILEADLHLKQQKQQFVTLSKKSVGHSNRNTINQKSQLTLSQPLLNARFQNRNENAENTSENLLKSKSVLRTKDHLLVNKSSRSTKTTHMELLTKQQMTDQGSKKLQKSLKRIANYNGIEIPSIIMSETTPKAGGSSFLISPTSHNNKHPCKMQQKEHPSNPNPNPNPNPLLLPSTSKNKSASSTGASASLQAKDQQRRLNCVAQKTAAYSLLRMTTTTTHTQNNNSSQSSLRKQQPHQKQSLTAKQSSEEENSSRERKQSGLVNPPNVKNCQNLSSSGTSTSHQTANRRQKSSLNKRQSSNHAKKKQLLQNELLMVTNSSGSNGNNRGVGSGVGGRLLHLASEKSQLIFNNDTANSKGSQQQIIDSTIEDFHLSNNYGKNQTERERGGLSKDSRRKLAATLNSGKSLRSNQADGIKKKETK